MSFSHSDRLRDLEREVQALRAELARRPVREPSQRLVAGGAGTLITAKPVSAVTSGGDFLADVVNVDQGEESNTQVTVVNRYGETLAITDEFPAWKRDSDGKYLPDRTSGAGLTLYRFTLTAAMALGDTYKAATEIAGGSTIQVVDEHLQFCGKSGYHGFALKFTDNYLSTGSPGAYILTMQAPMRFLAVSVDGGYSSGGTSCVLLGASDKYGQPFNGGDPGLVGSAVSAVDPFGVAADSETGDKWVLIYDETLDQYNFLLPLEAWKAATVLRVTGTTSGTVIRADSSMTLTSLTLVDGTLPSGESLPTSITVTIDANAKMDIPGSTAGVFAILYTYDGGSVPSTGWRGSDTGNSLWVLRGYTDWGSNKLLSSKSGAPEWITVAEALELLTGYDSGADQSIYGDDGEAPQWKTDDVCS